MPRVDFLGWHAATHARMGAIWLFPPRIQREQVSSTMSAAVRRSDSTEVRICRLSIQSVVAPARLQLLPHRPRSWPAVGTESVSGAPARRNAPGSTGWWSLHGEQLRSWCCAPGPAVYDRRHLGARYRYQPGFLSWIRATRSPCSSPTVAYVIDKRRVLTSDTTRKLLRWRQRCNRVWNFARHLGHRSGETTSCRGL